MAHGIDLIESESQLIELMTRPSPPVVEAVGALDGDILILGVGGKMGPTLAELMVRAGCTGEVIGVARFSDRAVEDYLQGVGVSTVRADLLEEGGLAKLPDAPNVLLLAGFKFGATGNETMAWAMNTYLPLKVVERYQSSRIVYVSSGNVYAYTSVSGPGADEHGQLAPIGEYAQSRLGGERLAEFAAQRLGVRLLISRLFYATELRYGIIHDIAWKVWEGEPIDLSMGHVNQIWQGDANSYLARSFPLCRSPTKVLNLTGRAVLSVRQMAERLGEELGREPIFQGEESDTALLGEGSRLFDELGPAGTDIDEIIRWMANWVRSSGKSLGKPTRYDSRTGEF
jgi:nucleoside-diphosphate-sugar epimerase